ncbi:alanine--tRNA ligase [Parasaccharibacter apium]|nr:alanine--tRNA ligase [Parasaccharibacter apium]
MISTNDIRSQFLNYFESHGHQILPSASLVPQNDPSLLFTNAGMVPFKNVFTGQESLPFKRATTAQKVVRAGGKHNDLDNVGYTARHHTFFEMMGNFSFGDYFKAEVIEFAWTLLTKGFSIPAEKLLVTVYADDHEAAELWKKIAGLTDEKIIRIATSDNFWRMGDTGPCGPSSEIFYDHGPSVAGGPPGSPDEDGDRFVEIWNLVFMQFFEEGEGKRSNLPHPSIDTGMGLERFAAVMQGKKDNYDTDTLRALIEASAELMHQGADGRFKTSHRVVADHLRSTAFLISDGVLPSREGRGYVLRRIMRRAMRHLHLMGAKEPVFYRLLPALIQQMGHAYPELNQHKALIAETMKGEEERFTALLGRGMALLEEEMGRLSSKGQLPGDVAFKLYDTFGFPLDLTQDVLRERGHKVDEAGFENAMAEQRQRARAAWVGSGDSAVETVWFDARDRFGGTEFLGYVSEAADAQVQAIFRGSDELAEAKAGDEVAILLNQSPFYGESGGQVGDHGTLTGPGLKIDITDTQKKNGTLIVHYGRVMEGVLKPGMDVHAEIDHTRRTAVRGHHSATHLLHEALRRHIGEHVTQKGSLNTPDRLRFDISQPRPLTEEELKQIEAEVNARIRQNSPVETRLMTQEQAIESGAMALFGEKYGDEVRVVFMGDEDEKNRQAYSIELCGGTHVNRLGEIGLFRILSESGVSSGVRRIEAVCGAAAEQAIRTSEDRLAEMAALLKVTPAEAPARLAALLEERKALNAQISSLQHKLTTGDGAASSETINGVTLAARFLEDVNPKDLKGLAEGLLKQISSGVVALISGANERGSIVIAISKDLTTRFDAVALVREASALMGGKGGGGRPDMAQAGGTEPAAEAVFEMIRRKLTEG